MHCPKCGAENSDGLQFCQSCSGEFEGSETHAVKDCKNAKASPVSGVLSVMLDILFGVIGGVLLLVAFIWISPVLAILAITGVIFLQWSKTNKGRLKGTVLTIAGMSILVICLAVVLYAYFVVPPKQHTLVKSLVCGTHMKGMANAMNVYAFDYNDKYPTGSQWCDLLMTHADVGPKAFVCPGGEQGRSHYALNGNALRLGKDAPANMVLMFECGPGWNQVGGAELLTTENHRGQGCNILFVDGHVEFIKAANIGSLRWTVEEGD